MAFKFPDKDPDEKLDYTVDWSRYLTGSQTIYTVGSTWKIQKSDGTYIEFVAGQSFQGDQTVENVDSGEGATTGLTLVSEDYTSDKSIIVLSKGIANTTYRLLCEIQINDDEGLITNREINLRVRERS